MVERALTYQITITIMNPLLTFYLIGAIVLLTMAIIAYPTLRKKSQR